MKWKEFLEIEDCDICPIKQAELCSGGYDCYDGSPIEPPCCSFDDETDLDKWIKEAFDRQKKHEEYENKIEREKREKQERANKSAKTRREMRFYCREEIATIKTLEKRLKSIENSLSLANSLAFALNITNEMFGYSERVKATPEAQKTIDKLKEDIQIAKEKYKIKRKKFYAERLKKGGTENDR